MELIISTGVGILLFLCFFLGYREGLRLGMRAARGIEPQKIKTPVAIVKEHQEQKKAEEKVQTFEAFDNYDGYTDIEREWMKGGRK